MHEADPRRAQTAEPEAIDAVVLWVDGSDPRHRAKLERHLATLGRRPQAAAPTRFSSMGEIDFCIAALLRFAPFLRRIHVVTDDQVPPVFERAARWAPALRDKLVLVDHRVIFAGHEDCLPTFNSQTIETMVHRVPGLAEQFVYFNDDVLLIHPVRPSDWFRDGQPIARGTWQLPPQRRWSRRFRRALRKLAGLPPAGDRASHTDAQALASALAGSPDRVLVLHHVPHALRRSTLERFFEAHPHALRDNIRHRLRDRSQFLPQTLSSHLDLLAGRAQLQTDARLAYLKPASVSLGRLARKLRQAADDPSVLFACVQSLDEAKPAAQQLVLDWMHRVIGQPEEVTRAT